jgi:predicted peptidase
MRSRRLAVTLVLGGIVACGGDGGSSGCVPTAAASCNGGGGGGGNVTTGFVVKSLSDGGTTYGYQVFIPANYNTTSGPIPVIVFMHGSVEKGSDNQAQTNVGLGPVVKASLSSFPAIVVFPQGPAIEGTVGNEIFDRITVSALDKTLVEYSRADPKRVYLTGISYGGIRGYEVAYRNPTKFAAWVPISASICASCISGSTSTTQTQGFQLAAQGLKPVPIWEFHGDTDPQISVNDSYAIKSAFTANGDPYQLTVLSGGHTIWDGVYARADLWTWVYQKTR